MKPRERALIGGAVFVGSALAITLGVVSLKAFLEWDYRPIPPTVSGNWRMQGNTDAPHEVFYADGRLDAGLVGPGVSVVTPIGRLHVNWDITGTCLWVLADQSVMTQFGDAPASNVLTSAINEEEVATGYYNASEMIKNGQWSGECSYGTPSHWVFVYKESGRAFWVDPERIEGLPW